MINSIFRDQPAPAAAAPSKEALLPAWLTEQIAARAHDHAAWDADRLDDLDAARAAETGEVAA